MYDVDCHCLKKRNSNVEFTRGSRKRDMFGVTPAAEQTLLHATGTVLPPRLRGGSVRIPKATFCNYYTVITIITVIIVVLLLQLPTITVMTSMSIICGDWFGAGIGRTDGPGRGLQGLGL